LNRSEEQYTFVLESAADEIQCSPEFALLNISIMENIIKPEGNYCVSLEGVINTTATAASTFFPLYKANQDAIINGSALVEDKMSYYAETLEPRYSYFDELALDGDEGYYSSDAVNYGSYILCDKAIKFFEIIAREK
jgi:hypothetical protein